MSNSTNVWTKLPKLAAKLAVQEQAPIASLWVDAVGTIGFANRRFAETMGYGTDELIDETLSRLVPSLNGDYWQTAWWPLLENEGQIDVFPLSWRHATGITINCSASVSRIEVAGLAFAAFYLWPLPVGRADTAASLNKKATAFLQHLGESVCLMDSQGVVRYANRAFCKLMGSAEANLLGTPLLEIVCPAKSQLSNVWNLLQQRSSVCECEFKNLAGKTLHIRMTVGPLTADSQIADRYLVSIVDITEQIKIARELEMQNASYERLASNIPGFIYKFRMTADGVFSFPYASRGCEEIFGVEPAKVANDAAPIVQTIHPDDLPMFQQSVLESAMNLSPWNFEARQKTSTGDWKWFHAASRPQLQDNGDIIWEGLVMDVTAQKKVEEELAKSKLAAEASATAKAQFLANMSHEIRTPLNAIIGLNRLVLKSELTPVQLDYLNKVQLSSENLLNIINNILDFSKIESGKLNVEQIELNLDDVLKNLGAMLEPVATAKKLELLVHRSQDVPLYMIGDSLRLLQVLTNLCSNAIKFTNVGEIVLSVTMVPGEAKHIRFSVRDTGIGITEKQKSIIFEAFSQADSSTTRHYGGTGLGLTISKHLIELMGGEIGVNSIEGKGSEFYFSLPLLSSADIKNDDFILPELEDWHVTLIMENETACTIFTTMLRDLRFKVSTYSLRETGIAEILEKQEKSAQTTQIYLLDWKIPENHKAEMLTAMEDKVFGEQIPVIINISPMEAESIKSLANRFDNIVFLNKPSTPSCLMDAIVTATGKEALLDKFRKKLDSTNLAFYEQQIKGLRVLVAEDNEINQEVVCKTLAGAGVETVVVNNGKEAIDHLAACGPEQYDAVLMDLQMPVMDGYEATLALRKEKRFDDIPIIAMTAHTIEADRQKCLQVGMQDHVGKPVELEQLFSKLARWIRTGRVRQSGHTGAESKEPDLKHSRSQPKCALSDLGLRTVNVRNALRLLQEDEQTLLKLLLNFAEEHGSASQTLRRSIDTAHWDEAQALVHKLKGISGNLHITEVFKLVTELEKAIKSRNKTIADQMLKRLQVEMGRFCKEVQPLKKDTPSTVPNHTKPLARKDADETAKFLKQLLGFLENNNWQAEDCLSQIRLRLEDHNPAELAAIESHILNLEFDAAAALVKKLHNDLYTPL